jgi:hypothetical protein
MSETSSPWPPPAFAGHSPASPAADAAGGWLLRRRRLAVLRAVGLPPLPATSQEPQEAPYV